MTTEQTQQVADMATAIRCTEGMVDFLAGGDVADSTDTAAEQWVYCGFEPDEAAEWWQAGCFDADRAAALAGSGLTPEQVSERRTEDEPESWGYAYCNADVTLAKVCEHFGVEVE
jgi:hypothetical protein